MVAKFIALNKLATSHLSALTLTAVQKINSFVQHPLSQLIINMGSQL